MAVEFAPAADSIVTNPSKWDIIPIHASDRATFKSCRRQWAWSSPSRLNLVPRADIHGIRENLWFGTGIHYALEKFYSPLRENPVVTWESWFNLQWDGGVIWYEELDQYYDRDPEMVDETRYRVRGLNELLPDPDPEKFMGLKELGIGMMEFYKDYAERNDNFTVIATEHSFSVPILDPDGRAMYHVDNRIMPDGWEPTLNNSNGGNIFGPLMYEDPDTGDILKQVHARGKIDIVVKDNEHGRYGLRDYKTASRVDDDYFKHLDLDEQVTTYLTFGEVEAKMYNLPYQELEYIDYVALFKGYPKPPTITSKGMPSIDRQKESTTAELFTEAIKKLGIQVIYDTDVKMQSYYTWLLEMGDKRFVWPETRWRNTMQRKNAMTRLYYEAKEMLNPDLACYPNPRKELNCLNCVFRAPCLMAEDGSDYVEVLENGYVPNWDR